MRVLRILLAYVYYPIVGALVGLTVAMIVAGLVMAVGTPMAESARPGSTAASDGAIVMAIFAIPLILMGTFFGWGVAEAYRQSHPKRTATPH